MFRKVCFNRNSVACQESLQLISQVHLSQEAEGDHSDILNTCLTAELSPFSFALILGQIERP